MSSPTEPTPPLTEAELDAAIRDMREHADESLEPWAFEPGCGQACNQGRSACSCHRAQPLQAADEAADDSEAEPALPLAGIAVGIVAAFAAAIVLVVVSPALRVLLSGAAP